MSLETRTANHLLAQLLFQAFRKHVEAFSDQPTIGPYTPHGVSHILGVEESITHILTFHGYPAKPRRPLSDLEYLLLRICAWSHDVGMIEPIGEAYWNSQPEERRRGVLKHAFLRTFHDAASAEHICHYLPAIFHTVVAEIRGGRRDEHGKELLTSQKCQDLYHTYLVDYPRSDPETADPKQIEAFIRLLCDDPGAVRRFAAESTTLAYTANLISRYHRRAEPLLHCPEERTLMGETIRTQFLASLFRLADALNVDRTRFERDPFEVLRILPTFTEESRLHWIKSFIVSAIGIDPPRHRVHVQADLPIGSQTKLAQLRDLLTFIVVDLEEDVNSVAKILLQNEFPPLLAVTSETHEIPAMEYQRDIESVLDHIYATSSPNTSQQITIALDRLTAELSASEGQSDMKSYLVQAVPRLRSHLGHQLEIRPCHEGLRKIDDLLSAIEELWTNEQAPSFHVLHNLDHRLGRDRLLWTLIEGVKEVFQHKREQVKSGSGKTTDFLPLLGNCSDIVVYGYSQQVTFVLSACLGALAQAKTVRELRRGNPEPKIPTVHVLECRTKTQYSPTGRLIYLDGQRYANALRDELPRGTTITLVPDAALGRPAGQSALRSTASLRGGPGAAAARQRHHPLVGTAEP